jgi:hypothetical protein
MEIPQLSELELKTLKLFAYYCMSYGANSVYTTIYLQDCQEDWQDGYWYSNSNSSIESYDKIDDLINKLVNDDSLIDYFSDCEGQQRIEVDIDCVKRILNLNLSEIKYGEEPHSLSYDLLDIKSEFSEETYNQVVEIFENLGESEGRVDFSGGGDDGWVDSFMVVNGHQVDLPASIEDMLYTMINGNFAGWENNEGASGNYTFDPIEKVINFDFNYHTEEWYNVDIDYQIKF